MSALHVARMVLVAATIWIVAFPAAGDVRVMSNGTTQDGKNVATILIYREINQGDAAAFGSAVDTLSKITVNKMNGVPLIITELDSKGGDVLEAEAIGRKIRASFIVTRVMPNKICASACVIVLVAGVQRIVGDGAHIGLHRPMFGSSYFAGLSAQDASTKYDHLINGINSYFGEMRASPDLLHTMMTVPSSSIKYLSDREIDALGVRGTDPAWDEYSEAGFVQKYGATRWTFIKQCIHQRPTLNDFPTCERRAYEQYPNN